MWWASEGTFGNSERLRPQLKRFPTNGGRLQEGGNLVHIFLLLGTNNSI